MTDVKTYPSLNELYRAKGINDDAYDTLGVLPTASLDEIKTAYRSFARKHPDVSPNATEQDKKDFKTKNAAYDLLKTPDRRAHYDAEVAATRAYVDFQAEAERYHRQVPMTLQKSHPNVHSLLSALKLTNLPHVILGVDSKKVSQTDLDEKLRSLGERYNSGPKSSSDKNTWDQQWRAYEILTNHSSDYRDAVQNAELNARIEEQIKLNKRQQVLDEYNRNLYTQQPEPKTVVNPQSEARQASPLPGWMDPSSLFGNSPQPDAPETPKVKPKPSQTSNDDWRSSQTEQEAPPPRPDPQPRVMPDWMKQQEEAETQRRTNQQDADWENAVRSARQTSNRASSTKPSKPRRPWGRFVAALAIGTFVGIPILGLGAYVLFHKFKSAQADVAQTFQGSLPPPVTRQMTTSIPDSTNTAHTLPPGYGIVAKGLPYLLDQCDKASSAQDFAQSQMKAIGVSKAQDASQKHRFEDACEAIYGYALHNRGSLLQENPPGTGTTSPVQYGETTMGLYRLTQKFRVASDDIIAANQTKHLPNHRASSPRLPTVQSRF